MLDATDQNTAPSTLDTAVPQRLSSGDAEGILAGILSGDRGQAADIVADAPVEQAAQDAAQPQEDEGAEPQEQAEDQSAPVLVKLPDGREITADEAAKGYLRHEDYTRKNQERAAEIQRTVAEREQYLERTNLMAQMVQQLMPPMPAPDQYSDTGEGWKAYARDIQAYQATVGQLAGLQRAYEAAKAQHAAEQQELLWTYVPEWKADPATYAKESAEFREFMQANGANDADVQNVTAWAIKAFRQLKADAEIGRKVREGGAKGGSAPKSAPTLVSAAGKPASNIPDAVRQTRADLQNLRSATDRRARDSAAISLIAANFR